MILVSRVFNMELNLIHSFIFTGFCAYAKNLHVSDVFQKNVNDIDRARDACLNYIISQQFSNADDLTTFKNNFFGVDSDCVKNIMMISSNVTAQLKKFFQATDADIAKANNGIMSPALHCVKNEVSDFVTYFQGALNQVAQEVFSLTA